MNDQPSRDRSSNQNNLIAAAWGQVEPLRTTRIGFDTAGRRLAQRLTAPREVARPENIPGYKILEEIHRGGQGVVYRALQESTQRVVAIKFMREGPLATPDERARFEREVRVLAQLRHPNIVSIFHSEASGGAYYYVMDYIDGVALDAVAGAGGMSVADTLRMFVRVCDAVGAAHLRGIIHRDLKPGNIRVDRDGVPHVLDFGLSKISGDPDSSSMTLTGQFVGTAAYASPEQAAGDTDALDIRTDVYSLGVLLFRLLTGAFPYDVGGPARDVLNNIATAEPARPRTIRADISDEVETITLRCLQKDPERRYQSAVALKRDIERYLNGEPIEAKRDSLTYVLRKQLARHKIAAGVLIGFVLVVTLGFATSLGFWRQAVGQRDRAVDAEKLAAQRLVEVAAARDQEAKARVEAEDEADKAREALRFLQGMITSVDPAVAQGRDISLLRDLLDDASQRVEDELANEPVVEAAVRSAIGAAYSSLALDAQAEPQLRKALELQRLHLGARHVETALTINHLALLLKTAGRYEESEARYREALGIASDSLKPDDPLRVTMMNNLGRLLHLRGSPEAAEALFREGLALVEARPSETLELRARLNNNLALVRFNARDYDDAERLFDAALALRRSLNRPRHPDYANVLDNLGTVYLATGQLDRAEPLLLEALEIRKEILPPTHPRLAFSTNNLANLYHDRGQYERAEQMYRETLESLKRQFGDEHPHIATTLNNLASLLQDKGDLAAAEPLFRESLALRRKLLGEQHEQVAESLNNLAGLLTDRGDFAAAEPLTRQALDQYMKLWGPDHARVALCTTTRAIALDRMGELQQALPLYRRALEIWRASYEPDHPHVRRGLVNLAGALRQVGELAESEALYREALEQARKALPAQSADLAYVLLGLGQTLLKSDQLDEASPSLSEALRIYEAAEPHSKRRYQTLSALGEVLTRRGEFEWAEQRLSDAYAGLEPLEGVEKQLQETAARLVALFEEIGDEAKASAWRARLRQPAPAPTTQP